MNVRPERFRAQLGGLKRCGYTAWRLSQIIDRARSGAPIPPKTFAITFDDGFEAVHSHAWPVLRELEIPATVFLTTQFLDAKDPFPFDHWGRCNRAKLPGEAYRPLSVAQCSEMTSDGLIALGAHTHTHADFRGRPDELRHDLEVCLSSLRELFGLEEVPFAFPFGKSRLGYIDSDLIEAARATGVTCALTTDGRTVRPGDDPFGWGRFSVYDFDTPAVLAAKCAGWFEWASRLAVKAARRRRTQPKTPASHAVLGHAGSKR